MQRIKLLMPIEVIKEVIITLCWGIGFLWCLVPNRSTHFPQLKLGVVITACLLIIQAHAPVTKSTRSLLTKIPLFIVQSIVPHTPQHALSRFQAGLTFVKSQETQIVTCSRSKEQQPWLTVFLGKAASNRTSVESMQSVQGCPCLRAWSHP